MAAPAGPKAKSILGLVQLTLYYIIYTTLNFLQHIFSVILIFSWARERTLYNLHRIHQLFKFQ